MSSKKTFRSADIHPVWTNDKFQFLLEIRDFEAKKGYLVLEWESIKDKYENILENFVSNLPKETGSEECVHSTDFFTREGITSKIKQIRAQQKL